MYVIEPSRFGVSNHLKAIGAGVAVQVKVKGDPAVA